MGHNADHHAHLLQYTYDDREGKNNVVEQKLEGNHNHNTDDNNKIDLL